MPFRFEWDYEVDGEKVSFKQFLSGCAWGLLWRTAFVCAFVWIVWSLCQ